MAKAEFVVKIELNEEFKGFICLFCDTLELLTKATELVCSNRELQHSEVGQRFLSDVNSIVERSKRVEYGKS